MQLKPVARRQEFSSSVGNFRGTARPTDQRSVMKPAASASPDSGTANHNGSFQKARIDNDIEARLMSPWRATTEFMWTTHSEIELNSWQVGSYSPKVYCRLESPAIMSKYGSDNRTNAVFRLKYHARKPN